MLVITWGYHGMNMSCFRGRLVESAVASLSCGSQLGLLWQWPWPGSESDVSIYNGSIYNVSIDNEYNGYNGYNGYNPYSKNAISRIHSILFPSYIHYIHHKSFVLSPIISPLSCRKGKLKLLGKSMVRNRTSQSPNSLISSWWRTRNSADSQLDCHLPFFSRLL